MMATEQGWAEKIGAPAFDSIREMVAALECDYDRLEELRDDRDGWESPTAEEIEERRAAGGGSTHTCWNGPSECVRAVAGTWESTACPTSRTS